MTEKLTDHERRCRELDRAFARYGMGRSEAEYFQSLLSCGERLIGGAAEARCLSRPVRWIPRSAGFRVEDLPSSL